jgi:hypothetical protein
MRGTNEIIILGFTLVDRSIPINAIQIRMWRALAGTVLQHKNER